MRIPFVQIAALGALSCTIAAQRCPGTWAVSTGAGFVIQTQFGPFPTVPVGFTASAWDHDGDPATLPRAVVGGTFSALGGISASNIVSRAPGAIGWDTIGPGLPFAVSAIAARPDGTLIAGGYTSDLLTFSLVPGLAEWDGTSWTRLPAPAAAGLSVVQPIEDIAVEPSGSLVIAGQFASVGGVTARGVARWNGQQWSALGAGLDGGVRRVVPLGNGELLAGVFLPGSGATGPSGLARWDGSTWTPAYVGSTTSSVGITDFELAADGTLYASGLFVYPGTASQDQVARWNGQDWEPLGAGFDATVSGAAVTRLDLLPDGGVVATGVFQLNGRSGLTRAAIFDGTSWSPIDGSVVFASSADQFLGVAALPNGEIVTAGGFGGRRSGVPIIAPVAAVRSTNCPASASAYGPQGNGQAGTNTLIATIPPFLGGNLSLEAGGFDAGSALVSLIGFATQSVPLTLFSSAADPASQLLVVPEPGFTAGLVNAGGRASYSIPVPNSTALIGGQLFVQVLEVGLGQGGIAAASSTNGIAATIGAL